MKSSGFDSPQYFCYNCFDRKLITWEMLISKCVNEKLFTIEQIENRFKTYECPFWLSEVLKLHKKTNHDLLTEIEKMK